MWHLKHGDFTKVTIGGFDMYNLVKFFFVFLMFISCHMTMISMAEETEEGEDETTTYVEVTEGPYKLRISNKKPVLDAIPDISPLSPDKKTVAKRLTFRFVYDISLDIKDNDREEEPEPKITSDYYISTSNEEGLYLHTNTSGATRNTVSFKTSSGEKAGLCTKMERRNLIGVFKSVTPSLFVISPGVKHVTLNMTVEIKESDGTVITLNAEKTVEFEIPEYIFEVYVRNATNANPHTFLFNARNNPQDKRKILDIGHASWGICIFEGERESFSEHLLNVGGQPWGLGDNGGLNNAILIFCTNNEERVPFFVSVPGVLNGEGSGPTTKRFAIKTKEQAIKALEHILEVQENVPEYSITTNNCVDECVKAVTSAGVANINGNIKISHTGKFRYKKGDVWDYKIWKISISDPELMNKNLVAIED